MSKARQRRLSLHQRNTMLYEIRKWSREWDREEQLKVKKRFIKRLFVSILALAVPAIFIHKFLFAG